MPGWRDPEEDPWVGAAYTPVRRVRQCGVRCRPWCVVHLPAMPQPKDFGLDAKTPPDSPGADRYARALEVWERAVRDISKRIGKKKG